ncbi:MAG TPA: M48 family metallopeptidase [Methylomirabilota bacterium]|nr:M48 family metallopeptidase [Methylomirabilota bacterium]
MDFSSSLSWLVAGLIAARGGAQWILARLNRREILAHSDRAPEAFRDLMTPEAHRQSVEYSLAKGRLHQFEIVYDGVILLLVLASGLLPAALAQWQSAFGASPPATAGFLFAMGTALTLPGLPLDWFAQFRLEERFGFNTTTARLWWLDRLKGLGLALGLGVPLLTLVAWLFERAGNGWWLWTWACLVSFQGVMLVLTPVLILPLFNKFTPLPEGRLKDRLLELARQTRFPLHSIQVMDGSRRSRHSNAFFTGIGRLRKIVLFDTLIAQLDEAELAAVLAHEIGHYKRGHVLKFMAFYAGSLLAGLWVLSWLARQEGFYRAFGFEPGSPPAALLLFGLLSGLATFWTTPVINAWSRRFEYEADAFAAGAVGSVKPLIGALRKLNRDNLSNLTPHPLYSWFHYSHPTLLERERALTAGPPQLKAEAG